MKTSVVMVMAALGVVAAVGAVLCSVVGLAAWSDAQSVCPEGNQCSDAVIVIWVSATIVVFAVAYWINFLWLIRRADRRSR